MISVVVAVTVVIVGRGGIYVMAVGSFTLMRMSRAIMAVTTVRRATLKIERDGAAFTGGVLHLNPELRFCGQRRGHHGMRVEARGTAFGLRPHGARRLLVTNPEAHCFGSGGCLDQEHRFLSCVYGTFLLRLHRKAEHLFLAERDNLAAVRMTMAMGGVGLVVGGMGAAVGVGVGVSRRLFSRGRAGGRFLFLLTAADEQCAHECRGEKIRKKFHRKGELRKGF